MKKELGVDPLCSEQKIYFWVGLFFNPEELKKDFKDAGLLNTSQTLLNTTANENSRRSRSNTRRKKRIVSGKRLIHI